MPVEPIGPVDAHHRRNAAASYRVGGLSESNRRNQAQQDQTCNMTFHDVFRVAAGLCLCLFIVSSNAWPHQKDNALAVIDGGVQRSEDAPFVPKDFQFLPGEYVYFTFHIAGFATKADEKTETKALSLEYDVTPQDANHVPLTPPESGKIASDLSSEDKNWTPKRRASFLLPSYVAAGPFSIHVVVRDLLAKTEVSRDYPFQIGGVQIEGAEQIRAVDFDFLRKEDDANALDLPAYAAGDTVWARFHMVGFKYEAANKYRLSYGVKILRPDGKPFLDEPKAARLESDSFYPAQYVPGELQITTPKNAARGSYELTLTVHDLVANQSYELKRAFTIE